MHESVEWWQTCEASQVEQSVFVEMSRRRNSAPIIPETTIFGSAERGSFTGSRTSLTG